MINLIDGQTYLVPHSGSSVGLGVFRSDNAVEYFELVDEPGCIDLSDIDLEKFSHLNEQNHPQTGGGSCNYYMVDVDKPTTLQGSYTVECNDLIESLGLTWQEANIYKEIFRTANERTHGNGKDGNNPKRAAEKVLFFAIRNAIQNGVNIDRFIQEINLK